MSRGVTEDERTSYDQLVTDRERRYRLRTEKSTCHSDGVAAIGESSYRARTLNQKEPAVGIEEDLPPGWECYVPENGQSHQHQAQEPEASIPWNEWNPYHRPTSPKNWFTTAEFQYGTSQSLFSKNPWAREYGAEPGHTCAAEQRRRNAARGRRKFCKNSVATI